MPKIIYKNKTNKTLKINLISISRGDIDGEGSMILKPDEFLSEDFPVDIVEIKEEEK